MSHECFTDAWADLAIVGDIRARRSRKPRERGATMVIDSGVGLAETRDILDIAADHVDLWKLSFGTSVFVPPDVLQRKIEAIQAHGITAFPGGTLFEAAIVQQHCRVYMNRARQLGFHGVEISSGTIDLPPFRRHRVIDCAREAGLVPITEVGKKDPRAQPPPEALAEQALSDLDWGARWVIVEGRESGKSVGIYDDQGTVDATALDTIAECMGPRVERLVWEAPMARQQAQLILRFGINVGLGNIEPRQLLALEALRSGLRFDTFKPIAEVMQRDGRWVPERVEPPLAERRDVESH